MRRLTAAVFLSVFGAGTAMADTSAMRAYLDDGFRIVGMASNSGGVLSNVDDAVVVLTKGTAIVVCSVSFPDYAGGRIGFQVAACDEVE